MKRTGRKPSWVIKVGDKPFKLKALELPRMINGRSELLCECECGSVRIYSAGVFARGITKSCGCERLREFIKRNTVHKGCKIPEYRAWVHFRSRCRNENETEYPRYGGRGITVCYRWDTSFGNFIADMGRRPTDTHSIDRIDNDGGYWCGKAECPDCGPAKREQNCRWATKREQSCNSRRARRLTLNGVTKHMKEWATQLGITASLLHGRLSRMSVEKALTMSYKPRKKKRP